MGDDERDEWERVGQTLDWVAGLVAARLDRDPVDLVWPAVVVGLVAGLGAEAVAAGAGSPAALTLVGVTLTVCGFGMVALLAVRFRRGRGGGARTAEADLLAPWLRRLQVLLAAVLVAVVGLAVLGAVTGSVLLVGRNLLEVGRVGSVVLALSWLLMDDDVGLPDWLASRGRAEATQQRRTPGLGRPGVPSRDARGTASTGGRGTLGEGATAYAPSDGASDMSGAHLCGQGRAAHPTVARVTASAHRAGT